MLWVILDTVVYLLPSLQPVIIITIIIILTTDYSTIPLLVNNLILTLVKKCDTFDSQSYSGLTDWKNWFNKQLWIAQEIMHGGEEERGQGLKRWSANHSVDRFVPCIQLMNNNRRFLAMPANFQITVVYNCCWLRKGH